MPDTESSHDTPPNAPNTIDDVLNGVGPMGDLSRFAIDDLAAEEEDEFFCILNDA